MTAATFVSFLTPCPHLELICRIKFTQPPLLRPLFHDPHPPSDVDIISIWGQNTTRAQRRCEGWRVPRSPPLLSSIVMPSFLTYFCDRCSRSFPVKEENCLWSGNLEATLYLTSGSPVGFLNTHVDVCNIDECVRKRLLHEVMVCFQFYSWLSPL